MNPPTQTRRSVIKKSAAALIGVPYLLTSNALGNADKAPASERVVLGHIGVGNRGKELLRGFMTCRQAQSVAVSDAYRDRREEAAATMGGKGYADFREMLARSDIDAVVIATPDHWHVPMAIAAARAGKDVYVEKPLGLTIEQDLACRKVIAQSKRIFQYGTQQRSMEHCRIGCELVRNGRVGKVHTIEVFAPDGNPGGSTERALVPPGLDYDAWIGPAPMVPYTPDRCVAPGTYFIYDYSIGYLAGWGAHPLDIMVWGSDTDLAGPMTCEGTGEIPKEGLYNTVIHWDVRMHMADGVKVLFKPGGDATKFIGPDGWVRISRSGIDAEPKSLLTATTRPSDATLQVSRRQDEGFLDAVRSRKPAVSTVRDAVRSDVISHLCNIAIRTGRKIMWDPKKEAIVGDEAATRMTTRPMRAPWKL